MSYLAAAAGVTPITIREMSREISPKDAITVWKLFRLMLREVLPNCLAPLNVQATLGVSTAILDAAALGFLGLGAPPPTPEWGRTIAESREFLPGAWWYAAAPGIAIFLTVMGFNLLGDGLRDVLDPRIRRARVAVASSSGDADG